LQATAAGRGRSENPSQGLKEVTILDQTETMATVKIVSEEFVDYLHLSKCGETWSIMNVLWDYRTG